MQQISTMPSAVGKYTNIELSNIYKQIKNKNPQLQEEGANKLYEYLQKHPDEMSDVWKEFHTTLQQPTKREDKLGVFMAINQVLQHPQETNIVMHVNDLIPVVRNQLENSNNNEFVEKGAECLGNLARIGQSFALTNIEQTLESAIQVIKQLNRPNNTDIKKYAMVLILKEFSKKLTVNVFNKLFGPTRPYLDVFQACRDNRETVRETAAEVINACISHLSERRKNHTKENNQNMKQTELMMIFTEVEKAFGRDDDQNYQHSALTILGQLIASEVSNELINSRDNQAERIINEIQRMLRESKSTLVKKKCIDLIPSMYKFIPAYYKQPGRLAQVINEIKKYIQESKGKDRGQGYISLGRLSVRADAKDFEVHVKEITKLIYSEIKSPIRQKDGLIKPNVELDALTCFTYLLKHHAQQIDKFISITDFISDIFYAGFKDEVIQCLSQISRICNGKYKQHCQIKLLNSCSIILTRKVDRFPFYIDEQMTPQLQMTSRESKASSKAGDDSTRQLSNFGGNLTESDMQFERSSQAQSQSINKSQSKDLATLYKEILVLASQNFLQELVEQSTKPVQESNQASIELANERTQMVTLALKTLSIFDFNEYAMCIVFFIEKSVLEYLDDENPQIRKLAMQTCCTLHLPSANQLQVGSNIKRIINKLLHRFFLTATTDNENRIRVTMLKHLNVQFDPFISRYENLLMLFNCLQDQNFEIRERTVRILGRLVPHNASQILPYLRQLIVSLISQLEQSKDVREREEAVKLIKMFVKCTPDLAKAYSTSILVCLIKKLEGERTASILVSSILTVISEISKINAEAIKPYLGDLFPLILECIKDLTSSQKRMEAVRTLISIIENTSFVVKPYFYFPALNEIIQYLVQKETTSEIRKHIFRLIGTLGAVDPYLIQQITRINETDGEDVTDIFYSMPQLFTFDENDVGMNNIREVKKKKEQSDGKLQQRIKQKSLITVEELNLAKEHKYSAMAVYQLMKVLIDPSMRDHHIVTLIGLQYIVRQHKDCSHYAPMIIPPLMEQIKQNDIYRMQHLFQLVTIIVQLLPDTVLKFADNIFEMIHTMIHVQPKNVLRLLQDINTHVNNIKPKLFSHMYLILPKVLSFIEQTRKEAEYQTEQNTMRCQEQLALTDEAMKILPSFETAILDDHLYLIIPLLLRTASCARIAPAFVSMMTYAIQTMNYMVICNTFREFAAQVIHQLLKILEAHQTPEGQLIEVIIESFSTIAIRLQSDFSPFIQLIQKAIRRNRLQDKCQKLDNAILQITKQDPIQRFEESLKQSSLEQEGFQSIEEPQQPDDKISQSQSQLKSTRAVVNFDELIAAFDTSKCHIADDWQEWLKKTSHQLLKQNPSPVLYACASLTEMYAPLAAELYNIAFVSCWRSMQDGDKKSIMEAFDSARNSQTRTPQVLQTILNLAEFMELDEISDVMFGSKTLAEIARQRNTLAKALYYWEKEFENNPQETIKLLIQTNNDLQQPEAARGVLTLGKQLCLVSENDLEIKEKSQEWDEILKIINGATYVSYEQKIQYQNKRLQCYTKLMNWQELSNVVSEIWKDFHDVAEPSHKIAIKEQIKDIASDAVYAAWNLQDWDKFKKLSRHLDKFQYERDFYSAVLEIKFPHKQGNYELAYKYISNARLLLDKELKSLWAESYNRAYKYIQELQFLTELEEVIFYKTAKSDEKKQILYSNWLQRQKCIPTQDLEAHQKLLNIRSLVIDKKDEIDSYINFAKMAHDNHNSDLSSSILRQLRAELQASQTALNRDIIGDASISEFSIAEQQQKINTKIAKVELAIYDATYKNNNQEIATSKLEEAIKGYTNIDPALLSTCYVKIGEWQLETLQNTEKMLFHNQKYDQISQIYEQIVENCQKATEIDPENSEAWQYYSQTNADATLFYSRLFNLNQKNRLQEKDVERKDFLLHREFGHKRLPKIQDQPFAKQYVKHLLAGLKGLIKQLEISSQVNSTSATGTKQMQQTLRLLKIWFQHGNLPEISQILKEGVERIDLKVWIDVIPQLLARIDINDETIRKTLTELVEKISLKFPQAILYSLSVQEISTSNQRKMAAKQLFEKLKTTQKTLIDQATTISTEMNRSAIVLAEKWQEAIEEASRIYFSKQDGKAMFNFLSPIHAEMENEPETMNEIAFYQGFASDLLEAFSWMKLYMRTERQSDINQAWDIYYSIFRRISQKQKEVTFYELRNVAPKLLTSENLDIAVPGTFKSNKPIVKIAKFASVLPVLPSKQKPRKMSVYGSDGREYQLLLKGHEDIRQDERVMQLFNLVNTLLQIDRQTSKKDLQIKRYPAIPLSQNTGLIGWVPGCDTLHVLIKEHRAENNIIPNIDYKLMEKMCDNFEFCPLINKVEIFRNALEKTAGEDLQKVLWVKSQNSEVWLERRNNYTRSLAVMSMVGYILGLGDRHPSNIMLERQTGKIVHIDFGDCFEVAMRRDKFPEKIPFRLTRMLTKAMEVSSIEVNFRQTCENTMKVLRDNRDSLLAIMEAFVYDPLISFRLLNPTMFKKHEKQGDRKDMAVLDKGNQQQPIIQDLLDSQDIINKLDENQTTQIREKIVEKTMERIQNQKQSILNKNYAESRFSRHVEDMELQRLMQTEEEDIRQKELNTIAEFVITRVQDKLRGMEFSHKNVMKIDQNAEQQVKISQKRDVDDQVDILIKQATNHENLAACYMGWCPYW